jgi:uncharacterized membrane protein
MRKSNDCYRIYLLMGIGIGTAVGSAFGDTVMGLSIGSGIGVMIGGLIEYSNNKKIKNN